MLIFIVTKFGADWFIFVDVRTHNQTLPKSGADWSIYADDRM